MNARSSHIPGRLPVAVFLWATALLCRAFALLGRFQLAQRGMRRVMAPDARAVLMVFCLALLGLVVFAGPYIHFHDEGLLRENPRLAQIAAQDEARYVRILSDMVVNDPQLVLRLAGDDVRLLFADPGLRRADGPVTVWQYRNEGCVLDIFLVQGLDDLRVMDYEVRSRMRAQPGDEMVAPDIPCLTSIMASARKKPASAHMASL